MKKKVVFGLVGLLLGLSCSQQQNMSRKDLHKHIEANVYKQALNSEKKNGPIEDEVEKKYGIELYCNNNEEQAYEIGCWLELYTKYMRPNSTVPLTQILVPEFFGTDRRHIHVNHQIKPGKLIVFSDTFSRHQFAKAMADYTYTYHKEKKVIDAEIKKAFGDEISLDKKDTGPFDERGFPKPIIPIDGSAFKQSPRELFMKHMIEVYTYPFHESQGLEDIDKSLPIFKKHGIINEELATMYHQLLHPTSNTEAIMIYWKKRICKQNAELLWSDLYKTDEEQFDKFLEDDWSFCKPFADFVSLQSANTVINPEEILFFINGKVKSKPKIDATYQKFLLTNKQRILEVLDTPASRNMLKKFASIPATKKNLPYLDEVLNKKESEPFEEFYTKEKETIAQEFHKIKDNPYAFAIIYMDTNHHVDYTSYLNERNSQKLVDFVRGKPRYQKELYGKLKKHFEEENLDSLEYDLSLKYLEGVRQKVENKEYYFLTDYYKASRLIRIYAVFAAHKPFLKKELHNQYAQLIANEKKSAAYYDQFLKGKVEDPPKEPSDDFFILNEHPMSASSIRPLEVKTEFDYEPRVPDVKEIKKFHDAVKLLKKNGLLIE